MGRSTRERPLQHCIVSDDEQARVALASNSYLQAAVQVNRRILGVMLQTCGFSVLYASTGREAVALFKQALEMDVSIFAVFMDVQMPEMDGLEATKRIRALEAETVRKSAKYRSVPVICVSAAEERDMAGSPALAHLPCELKQDKPWRCVGIDDLVAKPMDWSRLGAVLHALDWRGHIPLSAIPCDRSLVCGPDRPQEGLLPSIFLLQQCVMPPGRPSEMSASRTPSRQSFDSVASRGSLQPCQLEALQTGELQPEEGPQAPL